ncbi:MAG: 3-deoxy-7-phosphoheptulonate synthase [Solirubrobacterales bacterium]
MLAVLEKEEMKVTRRNEAAVVVEIAPGVRIGASESLAMIAGPCAVESEELFRETARQVVAAGATILRGGAFKPRTSPYSFQGLGPTGLRILQQVSRELKVPVVTEVVDPAHAELVAEYVDVLQIGARNMQNFSLLKRVGKVGRPVILKRGLSATIEEWLMAAEYILAEGNERVILCERGIRTHETYTRNTLDLSAVAAAKELSRLPVMVDPSHATGRAGLVLPMARAAVAAGADGIMVEVHHNPAAALSDGPQSLTPAQYAALQKEIGLIAHAVGRGM